MSAIDVRTTQNVTIQYELASLRERFFAFFIDIVIVFSVIYFLIIFVVSVLRANDSLSEMTAMVLYGILPVASFMAYQLLSEIIANGQSWGKKALGIKTIRLDGGEAGISDYLLRSVFHLVDTFFSFGVISALLISSSSKNQRLGDMTANTTVVRLQSNTRFYLQEILKINTLENYQPVYPQVKKLSEADMLLIKEAINRYRLYPNDAHRKAINQLVLKLREPLGLKNIPPNKIEFLKILIKDYIVLTR